MAHLNNPLALLLSILYLELPIPFVIALRPHRVVRLVLLVSQILVAWKATGTLTLGDVFTNYGVGSGVFGVALFTVVHFYFLVDPLEDGTRHVYQTEDAKDMSFGKRVWWAMCVRASIRGIGWNNQVSHVPPPSSTSRRQFLLKTSLSLAKLILIVDLASLYLFHSNPLFSSQAADKLPITSQGPVDCAVTAIAYWITIYGVVQIPYYLFALVGVGSGMWEHKFWPPMFGSFWEAYTLRRLWGRVWHQIMRRFVSSTGKSAAQLLGFQPGSNPSSYTQLYVAFFVSGIIHSFGDRMVGVQYGQSLLFFQIQAVAITFEDGVIALGKQYGVRNSLALRVFGLLWVLGWSLATTPLLVKTYTDSGGPFVPTLPFSPIESLSKTLGIYDVAGIVGLMPSFKL